MLVDDVYLFDPAPSGAVHKFGMQVASRRSQQVLFDQDEHVNQLAVAKDQKGLHDQKEKVLGSNTESLPYLPPDQKCLYAIDVLRALKASNRSPDRKVNQLLVLAPWLLLPNVGRYIRANPRSVDDVLCHALDRVDLDDNQFLALTFSAIMTGCRSWKKIPGLLKNNPAKVRLLSSLEGPLEECGLPTGIITWIIENLDQVIHQTNALINWLMGNRTPHPEEYLTLSTVVTIGDCLEEFVGLY